jgi:hypothetical protein
MCHKKKSQTIGERSMVISTIVGDTDILEIKNMTTFPTYTNVFFGDDT